MCYNSTSPFLFLQTYNSLIIGYIQNEGNYFFKKVDGFFKKGEGVSKLIHPLFYSSFTLSTT